MDVGRERSGSRERPRGASATRAGRRGASGQHLIRRKKTEQAHIVLGTNGLPRTDPDRFAFLIANTALGGGMSSRLFQEIRERARPGLHGLQLPRAVHRDRPVQRVRGHLRRPRASRSIALMREQIEAIRDGGLTEEEFERAKGHVKGSTVLSLEDPGGRMSRLGKSEISHGEILTVDETLRAGRRRHAGGRAPRRRAGPVPTDDPDGAGSRRAEPREGPRVIRVGVLGAAGRMGREVVRAVGEAGPGAGRGRRSRVTPGPAWSGDVAVVAAAHGAVRPATSPWTSRDPTP